MFIVMRNFENLLAKRIKKFCFIDRYKEHNIKSTNSYRSYDTRVPKYLHNRPKGVVEHIMKRNATEVENLKISQLTPKLFSVRSGEQLYQVWLGSDTQLPTCQCIDYRNKKLPCKHICAVVRQPHTGWKSLGSRFDTHPLFTLDQVVINSTNLSDSVDYPNQATLLTSNKKLDEHETLNKSSVEASPSPKGKPVTVSLPSRKKSNIRRQCIQEVKSLLDELYVITNKDVLQETLHKVRDVLRYTRKHHPKENGISLKDKSLSPKKTKALRTRKLTRRKTKNYFCKRVGSVAESRNAKIIVNDDGSPGKRKSSTTQHPASGNRKKRKELVKENEDGHSPQDVWVMINGIKLTYELRDILLSRFGWLTDDLIDASQQLIKQLNTGVGGLNCIAATTHCSRFVLPHGLNQTIQCHNIGLHWVTSTSISGKVVVYESLYRTVNDSLKRQLVSIYKGLCNDDGSLNITVVLQQRQKGTSDCGLFCVANAVALANGIDPSLVKWEQDKMRDHLDRCFLQKRMEMFPHETKQAPSTRSEYVVSVYCICLRHIPGAPMVHCNVCNNWFHHGPSQQCIKLSAKQAAALATELPFVCIYCDKNNK